MRFDIRYRTTFTYTEPVSESQNELRAAPATDDNQRLLDYRVSVSPSARVFSNIDSWGTQVDAFGIRRAHTHMEVTAESTVETRQRPLPTAAPAFDAASDPDFIDAHFEFLQSDRHTTPAQQVVDAARRQADLAGPDLVGVALAIHRFVGTHLRYEPNATEVGIAAEDVLAGGVGVCQDYAHLSVSMCRSVGLPARYVSGYLFTDDDSGGSDVTVDTVFVQTHAWIEIAIPGSGWLALDPTNGLMVGERHIKIGHGRSYDDVQPLRGVFIGPGVSAVEPLVEIRRVQATETWRPAVAHGTVGRHTQHQQQTQQQQTHQQQQQQSQK